MSRDWIGFRPERCNFRARRCNGQGIVLATGRDAMGANPSFHFQRGPGQSSKLHAAHGTRCVETAARFRPPGQACLP